MIAAPGAPEDPLKFRDTKKYVDRIKAARAQTGDRDAYQNAFGRISGQGVVIGVQDFAFMGGSMGVAVGEAFVAGVADAIDRKSVVAGKSVSVRVDLGGRRNLKKKTNI